MIAASMRRIARTAALLAVVLLLSSAPGRVTPRGHAQEPPPPGATPAAVPGTPLSMGVVATNGLGKPGKIDAILDKLARVDALRRAAGQGPLTAATARTLTPDIATLVKVDQLRVDDSGRVQVWVTAAGSASALEPPLVGMGMSVQRVDEPHAIVQGLLPINQLTAVASLGTVLGVHVPAYGKAATGSVVTQGDTILNTAALRSKLFVSGQGVRVGIISDGMEGLAASQASSDLGAVDTTTCNVVGPVGSPPVTPLPTDPGAGAEGTAMAEIVHDIAPGAQLFFGYFGITIPQAGTALDFNAAVNCLAANTDVVVDDIGWFNVGPYDGTSLVSQNTSNALNNPAFPIRGYYTAAANEAQGHYLESYSPSTVNVAGGGNTWRLHAFTGTANTTDAGLGLPCNVLAPAAPGICGDRVTLAPNGIFVVNLEWNDAFAASGNDYDLLLFDTNDKSQSPAGSLFLASTTRQTGAGSDPVEAFGFQNLSGANDNVYIVIGNFNNTAATRTFNMFVNCIQGCFNIAGNVHNFNTVGQSVPSQSDAGGGVISAGAISAANSPNFNTIEPYSSRGPTIDNRTKPDITGIDCVAITGAAGFFNPFCGTSAAAPHIAGMAALLLSCNEPLLSGGSIATTTARDTLRNALLNGATDLGTAGADNTFGHGRANMTASAPLAGCADTDNDGCRDASEVRLGLNPNNPWDFYSVPVPALVAAPNPTSDFRDNIVSSSDAQAVFAYFKRFAVAGSPDYEQDLNANGIKDGVEYDRTAVGPAQSGPPDGVISPQDAQLAFAQFKQFFTC